MKSEKNNNISLYKIFVIMSILICIFLLPFVNSMTSKFPTAYPGNESESGVITSEIANQIAIYVWPILIIYLIMLIILIVKKTNYRKVYYPLALLTLIVVFLNLGIIYSGYTILWSVIILFYPVIFLLIAACILGNKLDNNKIKKKTVGIIVLVFLLVVVILPMVVSAISINNLIDKSRENMYNNETIKPQSKIISKE